jgi:3-phosphoinositide dependent protein kinase-1
LGAGNPGTDNDIKALRSHPFFTGINWETLWTDPHPPIEPGLVKRDPPPNGQTWEDIAATWDALVGNEVSDDDELEWAPDGDGTKSVRYENGTIAYPGGPTVEEGPLGEIRRPEPLRRETGSTVRTRSPSRLQLPVPGNQSQLSPLTPTRTSTSSSEGGVKVEDAIPESPKQSSTEGSRPSDEQPRGRSHTMSPIQGNGPPTEID